jgi:hypothetical protein
MAESITVTRKLEQIGKGENKFIEVIKVDCVTAADGTVDFSGDTFRVDGYITKVNYFADKTMTANADINLNQAGTDTFYTANTRDSFGFTLNNIPGSTQQFHGTCALDKDGVNTGASVKNVLCTSYYQLKVGSNSVATVAFTVWIYVSPDPS